MSSCFPSSRLSEPTVDVTLFLRGHDGHQMSSQHAAVLLCDLPAQTLAEVSVAETVELIPTQFTLLQVWKHHRGRDRTTRTVFGFIYWALYETATNWFDRCDRSNFHCSKKAESSPVWQKSPPYVGKQRHLICPPLSVQVPPLRQGSPTQASETKQSSDYSAAETTCEHRPQSVYLIIQVFIIESYIFANQIYKSSNCDCARMPVNYTHLQT